MSIVHKNCRLAYGCTRIVVLFGPWAFKIPSLTEWRLFLLGLLANMQESTFSKAGWPELCPVLFSLPGSFLVVMRRAREMTDQEFLGFDVGKWVDRGEYTIPVEFKSDSFGYLDDRIVAIDYGN